jgi:hypothetical protein
VKGVLQGLPKEVHSEKSGTDPLVNYARDGLNILKEVFALHGVLDVRVKYVSERMVIWKP